MRRTAIALTALALVLSACNGDDTETSPSDTTPGVGTTSPTINRPDPGITGALASQTLVQFDACDDFLDYVKQHALELVGPYGLQGSGYGYGYPVPVMMDFAREELAVAGDAAVAAPAPAPGPSEAVQGVDFSGTNVQELGVDEPDIVKTDGRRIVALSEQTLFVIDVTGDEPELVGKIALQDIAVSELFLYEDRVLALGGGYGPYYGGIVPPDGYYQTPISKIVEVDISGSEPTIGRTLEFDGSYISARLVDDTARIVVTSQPTGFVWELPEGGGLKAERDAEETNREIIKNSTIENWVPYFVLTNADGDVLDEGVMVDCSRARHPGEFAGLDLLTVMSVDMSRGLRVADATGVLASGQTVYASTDNLYVATQRWYDWRVFEDNPDTADFTGVTTQIHEFDITDKFQTEYVASGSIKGFLLNQFAMSEYDGYLRVASTTEPEWRRFGDFEQESLVTVLEPVDGELVTVGQVGGLGKGERIYSVRFIDDAAYVVTFRQTDPLYTVDLSDPANPEVRGELKILGYSAYLHPLGDDLLLGVGQDADERGRTEGTQLSIFDVSDLADPVRISKLNLAEGSNSQVEYDHRAFLYWEPEDLAVIPIQRWTWDETTQKQQVFFGAVGVDVTGGDLERIGKIVHPGGQSDEGVWDWMAQIQRSIVIGDNLYTVSQKGLLRSDLQTLDDEVFLNFWS